MTALGVQRWRDPTGQRWTAMLTREPTGLHFSVQGNGQRPSDDEIEEAIRAHEDGAWMPSKPQAKLLEISELRDELGETVNPCVRQFVSPLAYRVFVEQVAAKRARDQ